LNSTNFTDLEQALEQLKSNIAGKEEVAVVREELKAIGVVKNQMLSEINSVSQGLKGQVLEAKREISDMDNSIKKSIEEIKAQLNRKESKRSHFNSGASTQRVELKEEIHKEIEDKIEKRVHQFVEKALKEKPM